LLVTFPVEIVSLPEAFAIPLPRYLYMMTWCLWACLVVAVAAWAR
jgi:hypothetical protein